MSSPEEEELLRKAAQEAEEELLRTSVRAAREAREAALRTIKSAGREVKELTKSLKNAQAAARAGTGTAEAVSTLEAELAAAEKTLADAKGVLNASRALATTTEGAVATTEGATLTARAVQVFGQIGARLGLSGTMATAAGGTVVAGGLIAATIIIARLIGGFSADSPISAGTPNRPSAAHNTRSKYDKTYNSDAYAVFGLTNVSGGSIVVAQESSLKNAKTCDFAGGGPPGCQSAVTYKKVSADFASYEAAHTEWCTTLKGARTEYWAIAGDSKAEVYGRKYWIGTAPDCQAGRPAS